MTTRKEISKKIREVKNKMRDVKKTDRDEYEKLHAERLKLESELAELKKNLADQVAHAAKVKLRKQADHKKFIMGGLCVKYFGLDIEEKMLEEKLKTAAGK
ncbi:MAG: hypothetical protein EVG15_02465 [Candidatus Acididesulfobacter diazotrophicus]|uniref:Uncharacterized protein n=1 Tax=Candidatus Acididesulfobacter diazotrophicus TaxID=2597226 RepID=A0A519BNY8_9DELT|nr:MAG: hypothetical protein EVG15_02465 [Candidatus Acididesulfobacter diazotrophicus]